METLNNYILLVDSYFGSAAWFPLLLLSVGIFFTLYLGIPQIKYFSKGWKILFSSGMGNEGQTSPFQALSTALSGTVGTGCILELRPENTGGWIKKVDIIKLEVEDLGVLKNTIV